MSGKPGPTPTGCYKCGRPGHWSRDCPSNPSSLSTQNPSSSQNPHSSQNPSSSTTPAPSSAPQKGAKTASKPASLPRKRPKLTPDLLLSNDGLGYVLENFPRMVKLQGRGHEVDDLQSLLEAYMHWHSRILPYYSFDQFVEKAEKVGSTKRVRVCVHQLREKIFFGDKAEMGQPDADNNAEELQHPLDAEEGLNDDFDEIQREEEALSLDVPENILDELYEQTIEKAPEPISEPISEPTTESQPDCSVKSVTDEQRARIEANRQRALERAKERAKAASASLSGASA